MKLALLFALFVAAPNPVEWKIDGLPAKPVKPGAPFTVRLTARIGEGWHLYWLKPVENGPVATRIDVPSGAFALAGRVRAPDPEIVQDPNFGMEVGHYSGETVFTLPLTASPSSPSGEHELAVNATYQTCNDRICLPPRTVKSTARIAVKR